MFESIAYLFDLLLYQPLFNALVLFYKYIPGHDFGAAVILLTLLIRIILLPVASKSLKSQKAMQKIQPALQEIQKKYKNDKERLTKETLEVYRKEKINPFSGLFLGLVQLPVLIALYGVFWKGIKAPELSLISLSFLGLIDLSKPNIVLAVLAGILQYFQTKMILPKVVKKKGSDPDMAQMMQAQMTYFMPVFTVIILFTLPSAIGLYWTASGIFSIVHQYFILKKQN